MSFQTRSKAYEQGNAIKKTIYYGHYYITRNKYNELSAFSVKGGDIIISCAGTIGEIYKLPESCENGVINQALMRGGCQLNNDAISFQLPLTWNLAKSAIVRSTISRVLDTTIDFLLKRANQCLCLPLFCSRYTVCDLL